MPEEKEIVLRTEDVNEIMSAPPKWIFRWGISIILLVFALIFCLSYSIKYPEVIQFKVTLNVDSNKKFANTLLPSKDIIRVKIGQKISIKIDKYAFSEYGVISGSVKNISFGESEYCFITLELPQGLKTSFDKIIPYQTKMTGVIDITIGSASVSERIFSKR
jgi:hypothetical protein